jgi:hypothetical protein
MSDSIGLRRTRLPLASLAAALASSLLYASVFLSFAFLVPVQAAFGKAGRRAGVLASLASMAVLAPILSVRLIAAKAFGILDLGLSLLLPALLLGTLALMNARFWVGKLERLRILGPAALCALAALPGILYIAVDPAFSDYLASTLASTLAPLGERAAEIAGESYDTASLQALLDPASLAATAIATLRDSYAALLLAFLGGSWWIGNRAAGPGSRGREVAPALEELRVPYAFLWPFLASWSALLAALLLDAPTAAVSTAWNLALSLSLVYAVQGLGIADHYLKAWNTPKVLRIILTATAVAAAMTSPAGIVIAVAIPLLGVTEVWIPHRNPKGVGI